MGSRLWLSSGRGIRVGVRGRRIGSHLVRAWPYLAVAALYCSSTLAGIRPRAGTLIRFSSAHTRMALGSRPLVERLGRRVRPLAPDEALTGRAASQNGS